MPDDTELEQDTEPEATVSDAPGLDTLIAYLNEHRGFDFAGYKRAGLERRLLKRVRALGIASFDEYVDYLEVHPDEFDTLFNSVLINATSFFRDASAWQFLTEQVVPQIVDAKKNGAGIRVWSAGCATGQEAYSLAMVLAEALGLDAFARKVKIYATDMDDDALAQARLATYTPKELSGALMPKTVERATLHLVREWHFGVAREDETSGNLFEGRDDAQGVHGRRAARTSLPGMLGWAIRHFARRWTRTAALRPHAR